MIVKRKLYSDKGKESRSSTGEKVGKALLGVGTGLGAYAGGHLVSSYHQGSKAGLVDKAGGATNFLKDMRKASKKTTLKDIYVTRNQINKKITDPVFRSQLKNIMNSTESMKFARGAGKAALATAGIGGALYLGNKLLKKKER